MNFNKRLIIQFILQHVFVLVTLLIAVIASFSYLIFFLIVLYMNLIFLIMIPLQSPNIFLLKTITLL